MTTAEKPARRSSGSNTRQRTELTQTRFTPAELAEVEEAASRYGLALASFSRAAQLSVARGQGRLTVTPVRSVRRPSVEKEQLARVLGQLGKIGSNLNQVAKAMHKDGADIADIMEAVAEVRETSRAVMQAMGRAA